MAQLPVDQPSTPTGAATKPAGMSRNVKLLLGCAVLVPLLLGCIGVLAATAIPTFLSYTLRSKTAEAGLQIRDLSQAVIRRCEEGGAPVSAGPLPVTVGSERQVTNFGVDPGFATLRFDPREPLYYQYSVRVQADGATTVLAQGDLDGDGMLSTFEVTCAPSCACTPLYVENELE